MLRTRSPQLALFLLYAFGLPTLLGADEKRTGATGPLRADERLPGPALAGYEKDSLLALDPAYGRGILRGITDDESPLAVGDRRLCAGDYSGALGEYLKLLPITEDPATWQAQLNSMIANRRLGRMVRALQNNEALIESKLVPDHVKTLARRNAAIIARDLCYGHVSRRHALAVKSDSRAPTPVVEEMDGLLAELRSERETKNLSPDETRVLNSLLLRIRPGHPRMFLNRDSLSQILECLKRPRVQQWYTETVKTPAAEVPSSPELWDGTLGTGRDRSGKRAKVPKPAFRGVDAARCALVYLVEKNPIHLEKGRTLLRQCAEAAALSFECRVMAGDYWNQGMIYALSAYDWLHNDLARNEREAIIAPLLEYVYRCRTEADKFVSGEALPHEGGFYGTQMLKWYAGLAAIGDGIDEGTARKLLVEGYREHEVMLAIREAQTSDDGGFISTANNYVMNTYPWASLNYFLTYESATGERPAKIKHLKYFPQWCFWSTIKGTARDRRGRTVSVYDFGVGDTGNAFLHKIGTDVGLHMYEIMHILWDHADVQKMCQSLLRGDPFQLTSTWPGIHRPLTPFFLYRAPAIRPEDLHAAQPPATRAHARFFEEMGIVFMRSGSTSDDTYACFVTGKNYSGHRHFDAGHFMIYKHDFLALDTGTRIGFRHHDNEHLNNYYCQSVAHNTILIHMPGEELPDYWVRRKDRSYYSHGGQSSATGDRTVAYETTERYTYVADDMTGTYSPKKCSLALRQFVFVYPDVFLVADRVASPHTEYRKEFLLHTQNEPVCDDQRTCHADDGGGRMFCRTLLPSSATRRVVGGDGHEFEASGRNWVLPKEAEEYAREKNYLGRFRLEISPEQKAEEDVFLHVIQVGRDTLPRMLKTELLEDLNTFGAAFRIGETRWEVRFARRGPAGGSIRLQRGEDFLLDRTFRDDVQPQAGIDCCQSAWSATAQ